MQVCCLQLAACSTGDNSSSSTVQQSGAVQEQNAQVTDTNNLVNDQPVPIFSWSQYRQTLIDVEEIEANGENTTTFGISNNGVLIWHCSSLGMPVPADAQLSNPDQIIADPNGGGYQLNQGSLLLPQQDPIGAYTGPTTGTNTLCVGPGGKQYIQYWEGYTDAVSGPATWDATTHQVVLTGPPVALKQVDAKAANAQASASASAAAKKLQTETPSASPSNG